MDETGTATDWRFMRDIKPPAFVIQHGDAYAAVAIHDLGDLDDKDIGPTVARRIRNALVTIKCQEESGMEFGKAR